MRVIRHFQATQLYGWRVQRKTKYNIIFPFIFANFSSLNACISIYEYVVLLCRHAALTVPPHQLTLPRFCFERQCRRAEQMSQSNSQATAPKKQQQQQASFNCSRRSLQPCASKSPNGNRHRRQAAEVSLRGAYTAKISTLSSFVLHDATDCITVFFFFFFEFLSFFICYFFCLIFLLFFFLLLNSFATYRARVQ